MKGIVINTQADYQVRSVSERNYIHYPIHPNFPVNPSLNGKRVQYEPIKYFGKQSEETVADIKIVFGKSDDAPMGELLNTLRNTAQEIFRRFDLDSSYGEIDIQDEVKWNYDSQTVSWVEGEDNELYANEVMNGPQEDESGEYTIFYVDNSCGERFYQIFKNSLRDEDLVEYC